MRLANKVAMVTGSAGGMGKAGVELFAREGAKVVVADIQAGRRIRRSGDSGQRRGPRSRPA